jgi:hypothetical protein
VDLAHIPGNTHPRLILGATDRQAILQRAGLDPTSVVIDAAGAAKHPIRNQLWQWLTFRYEDKIPATYAWEGPRSEALLRLALLTWLVGHEQARPVLSWSKPTPELSTLAATLRIGVNALTLPERQERDRLKGPGPNDSWGFLLDAGTTLWRYALVYDFITSPEARAAGVDNTTTSALYERIADGSFRLLVAHLRSLQGSKWGWGQRRPVGNNWISRELAGVGMACLAFQERFLAEPEGSQRRKDYADGLDLVRRMATEYLEGWATHGDREMAYYYEGPHYFRFWIDTFLPFASAHARVFPDTAAQYPALTLAHGGPMAAFLRCQAAFILPTHTDATGVAGWSAPPWDDSWLYPEDTAVPMALAAALLPSDRPLYLAALARAGTAPKDRPDILIGNPLWDEVPHAVPQLPPTVCSPTGGVALVRTGGEVGDLTVGLKNSWTQVTDSGEWTSDSHSHADNGQVIAYRQAEPLLIDPGYGASGYPCPQRAAWHIDPGHHNLLLVGTPDTPGKPASEQFRLPVWSEAAAPRERISRCERREDALGQWLVTSAELPTHRRIVIVPDRRHLLVVDLLPEARPVRLCWWGNGSVTGRDNPRDTKGNLLPGDPEKRSTARIDTHSAEAIYTRGPALATRISVAWPQGAATAVVEGGNGPWWYPVNLPLSGMQVTATTPTRATVTLIDIADLPSSGGPTFSHAAQPVLRPDGSLESVTLSTTAHAPVVYAFSPLGEVTRAAP